MCPLFRSSGFDRTNSNLLLWFIGVIIVIVAGAHAYAAFNPSALNWGFHHLAFYPVAVRIVVPILMMLVLVPLVRTWAVRAVKRWTTSFMKLGRSDRIVLGIGISVLAGLVFWVARERLFLLGDGYLVARNLPLLQDSGGIPKLFRNEPLSGWLDWNTRRLLIAIVASVNDEFPVQFVSILFGIGCLWLVPALARRLAGSESEGHLFSLFVLVTGGSQLFFSYVENYTPLYFAILLFLWLGVSYLQSRVHAVLPSAAFGLMFTFHFGTLFFFPAVGALWYVGIRRRQVLAVTSALIATILVVVALLWMCGYTFSSFADVFFQGGKHFVPLGGVTANWQAYSFFSVFHLIDFINLQLLIAPFALLVLVVLCPTMKSKNSVWWFLLIAAVCGLAFIVLMNPDLGMSRDWDLFSTFNVGIIVAAGYLLVRSGIASNVSNQAMTMMVWVTLIHTIGWIGINANSDQSLARFHLLLNDRCWGKTALTGASEELAIFYRERNDYQRAIEQYEQFLSIDTLNPRILGNLADVYRILGDGDRELYYYEQAVKAGTNNPQIHRNLGVIYGQHERYSDAIVAMKRAIELNPRQPDVINSIGVFVLRSGGGCERALEYFQRAIEIDSAYALAYLNAGECCEKMGDRIGTVRYLERFLQLAPDYPDAQDIRRRVQSIKQ